MLPWVYGFEWTPTHVIFIGVFFAVASVVIATVATALLRSTRDLSKHRSEDIQWHSDFEELLPTDRSCRHHFTGELKDRVCELGFDCRKCATHSHLVEQNVGILNRYYHRGHTWVRLLEDGTAQVGLDEIGRCLIGQPDSIELPEPGCKLKANGPAWSMKRNGREFQVRAPLDGEVIETQAGAKDWVLRIRPRQPLDTRHLLRGGEVHAWYRSETDRLQIMASELSGAPALADGGQLMDDLSTQLPPSDWEQICSRMFLTD